jgi:putative two-component system response regulator
MAIADVFDALTTARVYKEAWPHDKAIAEIKMLSGSHFDPVVVQALLNIQPELLRISQQFSDEDGPLESGPSPPLERVL